MTAPTDPADPTRGEGSPTGELPSEQSPRLAVPRPDEAAPVDELGMYRNWLGYLRGGAVYGLDGLDDEQIRWRPAPTANSLGIIVRHLGLAERLWLRAIWAGEPMDMGWRQHMFELPDDWGVDDVVGFYRAETAAADIVLDSIGDLPLDAPSRAEFRPTTLRWVLVHLIEETARHLGHLDITRELVDGRTGR